MRQVTFVVPGDIETRTGGYIYDKRMAAGLRALGWAVDVSGADLSRVADDAIAVVDGLALLTIGERVEAESHRLRIVPLIHLPLSLEVGLSTAEAARRHALERRALAAAPLVIVTGRATKELLERDGVDSDRIVVVEPGTDRAPLAHGAGGEAVALLCVAALTPGKGHDVLLRALASLNARGWKLTCAGTVERDRETADRVRRLIRDLALDDRVTLAGELDDANLEAAYDASDVFVLATLRETYGMAVAEAIAHGIPVVSTTVGAIADVVGDGGILVPPDDESALASALGCVIGDGGRRCHLTERARQRRERLTSWADAARALANALERVSGR